MLGAVIVALLLAAAYWQWVRGGVPSGVIAEYRHVSQEHYDRATEAARRFETERHGQANIRAMSAHMAAFSKHANELVLRLPNDLVAENALRDAIRESEDAMQDAMQGVRAETDRPLAFPFPIGSAYFFPLADDAAGAAI